MAGKSDGDARGGEAGGEASGFAAAQLAALSTSVPGAIYTYRLDGDGNATLPSTSAALEAMFGIPTAAMMRDAGTIFSRVPMEDLKALHQSRKQSMRAMAPWHAQFRYQHPSAGLRWIEGRSVPTAQPDGAILWHGFVWDVTERRLAETRLRESEERYRTLVENLDDVVYSLDADGRFTFVSPSVRHFGWSEAELLGQRLDRFVHPDDLETLGIHRELQLDGPEAQPQPQSQPQPQRRPQIEPLELRLIDGRGRTRVVRVSSRLTHEGGRAAGVSGVIIDLTRQRETEEQFRAAQKMEAVGRLAGGVAHDFNNLLTVISSYAELAVDSLLASDPLRADLMEIRSAAQRAASLTHQLLAFSRKQVLQPEILDLNELVSGVERMLRRLIGEDIELVFRPAPTLGYVKADPGQLTQVVLNLAINARDAMPDGGRLVIETTNVELDESYSERHVGVVAGSYVMLTISDTGHGMDERVLSRIFEPFFTTKPAGKGTGLGLATVHGIIEQSGGSVHVYSEVGRGTVFRIYLPRRESDGARPAATRLHPARARQSETVLVVEDDASVRQLMRRILAAAGYQVVAAANGGEALLECEQRGAQFDLLMTDVIMPGMSGRELATRVGGLCPRMRVLYVSGYTEDSILHHGVLDAGVQFITKPFTADGITRKVREVLDGE